MDCYEAKRNQEFDKIVAQIRHCVPDHGIRLTGWRTSGCMSEFIYILENTLMRGLVKIGRTERSVSERVGELSSHTGVPTSFTVVTVGGGKRPRRSKGRLNVFT
jgi:hypothetical protein